MFKKIKKAIGGGKSKKNKAAKAAAEAEAASSSSPAPAAPPPQPTEPAPPPQPTEPAPAPVPEPALAPAPEPAPIVPAPIPSSSVNPAPAPAAVSPSVPAPSAQPAPALQIQPPSAPTPPPKGDVTSTPVSSVVTAMGTSEDDKVSIIIPGGIPSPDLSVPRSELPKEASFSSEKPYHFIRDTLEHAPAGLFASLMADLRDISYAKIDENIVQAMTAEEQKKKAMYMGTVSHALGASLAQELAAHHAEKYDPRGVTSYRDFQMGDKPNEIVLRTHAEMLDGNNSRTGSWSATWNIVAQDGPGVTEAEISGEVQCRVWCYESCTAHMSCSQAFAPTSLKGDEETPLAKLIRLQIVKWEKDVLEALTAVYSEEMDGTLKAIRRTLPITRTRLKWDLIAQRAIKSRKAKK